MSSMLVGLFLLISANLHTTQNSVAAMEAPPEKERYPEVQRQMAGL